MVARGMHLKAATDTFGCGGDLVGGVDDPCGE